MRRMVIAIVLSLVAGAALAQVANVVTSITYTAGLFMPLTQTTEGALRVSCS